MRIYWSGMVVAAAAAGQAMAHMPYVLPSAFDAGGRDEVSLSASFTEDAFRPEVAMRDAPFEITGPNGVTTALPPAAIIGDTTLTVAKLPADGLYRVSSGQRAGRMGRMFRTAGGWTMIGEGAAPPAGAATVPVRSMTLADAYVLKGRPGGDGALRPRGKGLEIHPLGDPSAYRPGERLGFRLLFEGKPLPATAAVLFREAGAYDGGKQSAETTSDARGDLTVVAPDGGRYLLLVRHRAGPNAKGGDGMSYTATLAFEAG